MKISRVLLGALLVSLVFSGCTKNKQAQPASSTTTSASPNSPKPLHTMYAVGDINSFNSGLAPLARQIVKDDPNGTWWILGDAGYGDQEDVKTSYKEIVATIPIQLLHVIYGDHDYGTQDTTQFNENNKFSTGAESILVAQDNFIYSVDQNGELKLKTKSFENMPGKLAWTITGTNDICVETGNDKNTDCNPANINNFNDTLENNSTASSCAIAMWHHPVYAVIKDGGNDQKASKQYGTPLFQSAVNNGVDIVLNGDHHQFLATKKIDSNGRLVTADSKLAFTREFIVGTGGAKLSKDNKTPKLQKNAIDSDIRNEIGVLKIDLYPNKAELKFLTLDGEKYSTTVGC